MASTNAEKSFFDLLEGKQLSPTPLVWSYPSAPISIPNDSYIYSGELITLGESRTQPEKKSYILTLDSLIKCEGSVTKGYIVNPISASAVLPLKNPRIRKIEQRDLGLYYFFTLLTLI